MSSMRTFMRWAAACSAGMLVLAGCGQGRIRPVGPDFQQIAWLRAELAAGAGPQAAEQAQLRIAQSEERIAETVRGLVYRVRKADKALPDDVRRGGPNRNAALFNMGDALALIGDIAGAERAAARIPDAELRSKVYATMASWYLARGNLAEALRMAENVSNDVLAEGLHYDLAEACAKAGQVAEAKRRAATYGAAPKVVAYLGIARGQAATGGRDGAVETLTQARRIVAAQGGATADWRSAKPLFLRIITVEQCKLGDIDGARSTAALINNKAEAGRALAAIIAAACVQGRIHLASTTRAAAPTSSSDAMLDAALAQGRFFAGERQQAEQMLAKARQAADSITDAVDRQGALRAIARTQGRIGDFPAARATLTEAAKLIAKAPKTKQTSLYHQLAIAQRRAGDRAGAVKTANLIASGLQRGRAMSAIAETRGELALAEALDWKATAQHDLTGQMYTDLAGYLKSEQRNSPETQVNTLANAARSIAYALNFFQVRKLKWDAKRGPSGR